MSTTPVWPISARQGGEAYVRTQALRAIQLSKQRADEINRVLIEKYNRHQTARHRRSRLGRAVGLDAAMNRRVEVQWFTIE